MKTNCLNMRRPRAGGTVSLPAALLGAFLWGALAHPASAAPGPALPILGGPSSLSAGVFVPGDSNAKKAGGSDQFSLEFHYTVPIPDPINVPARTVITLGVETGARAGSHSTVIPIEIGEVFSINGLSPVAGGALYIGGGVGVFVINQHGNGRSLNNLSSTTSVGGYGEAGYNLTSFVFVNAKYQFVDRANGLSATVGLRF